jgi:molybdopterin/thiamine biosynthesis adenylyltransferase
MRPTYDELFVRNHGVFNAEELSRIRPLRVAVAGVGGLGGWMAHAMARLGVAEIRVADVDAFTAPNNQLQFAAGVHAIDRPKVDVVGEALLQIQPDLKLLKVNGLITHENADDFVGGCDVVIDGIDWFTVDDMFSLREAARARGIWVSTGQGYGGVESWFHEAPHGPRLRDLIVDENGEPSVQKYFDLCFPVRPFWMTDALYARFAQLKPTFRHFTPILRDWIMAGEIPPPGSNPTAIATNMLATEIILRVVRQRPMWSLPDVAYWDAVRWEVGARVNGELQRFSFADVAATSRSTR